MGEVENPVKFLIEAEVESRILMKLSHQISYFCVKQCVDFYEWCTSLSLERSLIWWMWAGRCTRDVWNLKETLFDFTGLLFSNACLIYRRTTMACSHIMWCRNIAHNLGKQIMHQFIWRWSGSSHIVGSRDSAGVERRWGPNFSELILRSTILGGFHVRFLKNGRVRTRATRALAAPIMVGSIQYNKRVHGKYDFDFLQFPGYFKSALADLIRSKEEAIHNFAFCWILGVSWVSTVANVFGIAHQMEHVYLVCC